MKLLIWFLILQYRIFFVGRLITEGYYTPHVANSAWMVTVPDHLSSVLCDRNSKSHKPRSFILLVRELVIVFCRIRVVELTSAKWIQSHSTNSPDDETQRWMTHNFQHVISTWLQWWIQLERRLILTFQRPHLHQFNF